jgi:hypothetical protein
MKIQLKIEHIKKYIYIYIEKKNEIIYEFIWLQWSFPRSLH